MVCTSAFFEIVVSPPEGNISAMYTKAEHLNESLFTSSLFSVCFFLILFFFTHFFFYNPIIQEIWSIISTTRTEFELLTFTDTFRFCSYIGNTCKQELFNICEIKWLHGVIIIKCMWLNSLCFVSPKVWLISGVLPLFITFLARLTLKIIVNLIFFPVNFLLLKTFP